MKSETHQAINRALCGEILELRSNGSLIELQLIEDMKADSTGLVHGGFVFGAADYAAIYGTMYSNLSSQFGVPYWRMQELSTDEAIRKHLSRSMVLYAHQASSQARFRVRCTLCF